MSQNTFTLTSKHPIPALQITLEAYTHTLTGARHFHLASESEENMFLVALRTLPHDSSGVAHILEHTALCGSRSFPVRDPFFSMLKRSLQTFMNAFTSSDWTAYPFATQNKKDYLGLLDVYLDAVFFPKLDPLSFAQEWHRLEYDADTLKIKWIVYNEMKGVYGNVIERVYEDIKSSLHPVTTYHHDSGGNPRDIPDLTYEDFRKFHEVHYHPTNATFVTFGNISAHEIQSRLQERVLGRFGYGHRVTPRDEKRLASPETNHRHYPGTSDAEAYVHISSLLDRVTQVDDILDLQVFHALLTSHAGSPLTQWMDESEIIESPSPLMGIDDSGREARYTIGWITQDEHIDATIASFADWQKNLESWTPDMSDYTRIIDRLELQLQDRPNDSSYPLGLEYALTMMGAVMHDGDPIQHLDLKASIDLLRTRTQESGYFARLLEKIWTHQPHLVTNIHTSDSLMNDRETKREEQLISEIEQHLDEVAKAQIRWQAERLKALQESTESLDCLPIISRSDIPRDIKIPRLTITHSENRSSIESITLGVDRTQIYGSYVQDDLPGMSLTLKLLGQLSTRDRDYITLWKEIQAITGGVSQRLSLKSDDGKYRALITTTARHLERHTAAVTPLLYEITQKSQCDPKRLETLLGEISSGLDAEIIGSGQKFAMMESTALLSDYGALVASISGVGSLRDLSKAGEKKYFESTLSSVTMHLERLSKMSFGAVYITSAPSEWEKWELTAIESLPLESMKAGTIRKKAYLFESLVSYHSRAYLSDRGRDLRDDAIHIILAQYLRDSSLHTLIREQGGAYGGGASYDRESGVFRTFSYRDPRLMETYSDFDRGLELIADGSRLTDELLFGALLGCISAIDKPLTPLSETLEALRLSLLGVPLDERATLRSHLLDVTLDDLQSAARMLLDGDQADVSISGVSHAEMFGESGFEVVRWGK